MVVFRKVQVGPTKVSLSLRVSPSLDVSLLCHFCALHAQTFVENGHDHCFGLFPPRKTTACMWFIVLAKAVDLHLSHRVFNYLFKTGCSVWMLPAWDTSRWRIKTCFYCASKALWFLWNMNLLAWSFMSPLEAQGEFRLALTLKTSQPVKLPVRLNHSK